MKQCITFSLLFWCILLRINAQAQSIDGFWLGVTYPSDPNLEVFNYTMTLTQRGTTLGGTAQTSNPNVPFGGVAYLSGTVNLPAVTFSEADKNGSTSVPDLCFWRGKLTYNAADESLIGTYENITNTTTCTTPGGGKVELYRIVLKSGTTYCKGSAVNLVITGKNIQWYASANSTTPLAKGNTYSPNITQTTTFYVTQTLYKVESPRVPITVEIVEPTFITSLISPGCGSTNGSITVKPSGTGSWQYSLNNGALQANATFDNLGPGSYTVTAKNTSGCSATQSVTLSNAQAPVIDDLKLTAPRCETANGEVNVVASGGKTPYEYSMDNGSTYQSSSTFKNVSGGTYTFRVRDANKCEVNKALTVPASSTMSVLSSTGVSTSCGLANGEIAMSASGGQAPIQYSLDNRTFQADGRFANLKSGDYTVTARDNAGCTVNQTVQVAASSGPQLIDSQVTKAGCGKQDGAIIATTRQATGVEYSIDGQTFQQSPSFSDLKAGSYTVTAKDANNCQVTQTIEIPLDCINSVHLPTAFSPNADRVNDALTVHFAFSSITILQFTVYDRWGAVLYSRTNFPLSNGETIWDGMSNGEPVQSGMYTYRLACQYPDGSQSTYRQSVTLLNK